MKTERPEEKGTPDLLQAIPDISVIPDDSPSTESELEKNTLELGKLSLENQSLQVKLTEAKRANKLRKKFSERLWRLTLAWVLALFILVTTSGIRNEPHWHMELESSVLIALITSTTATVLGMFVIILKYLFPKGSA